MSELVLCTTDLSKRYWGNVLAVDELNLRVASGEIYAFLGLMEQASQPLSGCCWA